MSIDAIKETLQPDMDACMKDIKTPDSVWDRVLGLLENKDDHTGDRLAWCGVDFVLKPGVHVLTGIPNMGKSTFMDAVIVNSMRMHDYKWMIFSPEFPVEWHIRQLIEMYTGTNFYGEYNSIKTTTHDINSFKDETRGKLYFMEPPEIPKIEEMMKVIEWFVANRGVNAFLLDPYNEFSSTRPAHFTETEYVSQFMGEIRRFTNKTKVCGWIVAHPTKLRKEKMKNCAGQEVMDYQIPTGYDISGSANFYNKSDLLIAYHREKDRDINPENLCTVKVNKARKGFGVCGEYTLKYDFRTGIFTSV